MFTIGTSGHIDHGKTLLIKALTGIDTDRLPEEKKRGMTIDLGFAYFPDPAGEPVGVIDVPGHERFIRNMVAGACSLDLALLVVAANDGWMQQSGDHLLVLHYLGITDIILVISKCDIASPVRIREVETDCLDKIKSITGLDVPSVSVSVITGENIDKLKELILSELKKRKRSDESFPFLYVDRVFSIKGSGIIITGSLKGKSIDKETELICLPEGKPVRIRSLQSYNSSVVKAVPVSRLALNIVNLKKDEIHRGACLTTKGSDFLTVSEFIFRLKKDRVKYNIRNHSEVEIALGTAHQLGEIHFLKDSRIGRIILKHPVAARWNQPFLLIRHGGSSIIGGGNIFWIGKTDKQNRKKIVEIAAELPDNLKDRSNAGILFHLQGYIEKKEIKNLSPSLTEDTVAIKEWLFRKDTLIHYTGMIKKLAAASGGIRIPELPGKMEIPDAVIRVILNSMVEAEELNVKGSIIYGSTNKRPALSSLGKDLLLRSEKAGKTGLELSKLNIPGAQKELRNLARIGLIINLDGNIYYHPEVYSDCVNSIVSGMAIGSHFTIPDAKAKSALSRKYIIPLLNKMESDGFVKRKENERIVLKN